MRLLRDSEVDVAICPVDGIERWCPAKTQTVNREPRLTNKNEGIPDSRFAGLELVESLLRRLQMILQGLHSIADHLLMILSYLPKELRKGKDALVSTCAAVFASLDAQGPKSSTLRPSRTQHQCWPSGSERSLPSES